MTNPVSAEFEPSTETNVADANGVSAPSPLAGSTDTGVSAAHRLLMLSPVAAALCYPYLLKLFSGAIAQDAKVAGLTIASISLAGALTTPALSLLIAYKLSREVEPSRFALRARRLAYAAMCAPPLFVFAGVSLGLIGRPIADLTLWVMVWTALAVFGWLADPRKIAAPAPNVARLRVAHGLSAAILSAFLLFHFSNHVAGLWGSRMHGQIMEAGRLIYRAHWIEPLFVALLLFQIASGLRLGWRWSAPRADLYRSAQIGSGIYLAAFIVTHLNSALVSARAVRSLDTNWAWASGAPVGLIHDDWNIRLLPHYAFGVFFAVMHLACGLRGILVAHGTTASRANRLWVAAILAGAALAAAIMAGLLGLRL